MYEKRNTYIKPLVGFMIFICSLGAFSQGSTIMNAPIIFETSERSICATSSDSSFPLRLSFSGPFFNENNDFNVWLSDADGNFDNGTIIETLTDNVLNVDFSGIQINNINLPEGTAGDNYRIKIISTDPVVEGLETEPFEAYYAPDTTILLVNDGNDVGDESICSGAPVVLRATLTNPSLDVDDYEYQWTLESNIIEGETGSSIEVTSAGRYVARFSLGVGCTGSVPDSSSINIEAFDGIEDLSINESNTVNLCSNETYDLVATVDNMDYTYRWYKDDGVEPIAEGYVPVLTTPDTDQFGEYHLELDTEQGCIITSNTVTVQPLEGAGFTIDIYSATERVILPLETITLSVVVEPDSSDLTYRWFKDGDELSNTQPTLQIVTDGAYYVEVTDSSSNCSVALTSEIYTILEPVSLIPSIRLDADYEACNSTSVVLSTIGVAALATDGLEYELSAEQLNLSSFVYQWFKDDAEVVGATTGELAVTSYIDNGDYYLYVSVGTAGSFNFSDGQSDIEDVLLSPGLAIMSSSESNSICPGGSVVLSIETLAGFTYEWFNGEELLEVDDVSSVEVFEEGVYSVAYEDLFCRNFTESVAVLIFNEDVLEVSPETAVVLPEQTTTLTASGADSYLWLDEQGGTLSNNETADVSTPGVYTVIGVVDDCEVTKEVEVLADDGSFIIPNILTPFGSAGVNDTWEIPNKFSFQTNTQVIIYNTKGEEIYNVTEYQNDWPQEVSNIRAGMLFYFRVIQDDNLIKAGTISVLE